MKSRWLIPVVVSACGGSPHAHAPDSGTIDGSPDAPSNMPDAATAPGDPLAALAALPPICSDSGWCWSEPTPSGITYSAVHVTAADNIWLTGGGPPSYAAIMQWDGQQWISHKPPVGSGMPEYLLPMSLSTSGADNTWLLYNNLVEQYDGSAWAIIDNPYGPNAQLLNDVWVDPNGDPWVTSGDGLVRRYHGGVVAQKLSMGAYAGSIWGTSTTDVFITTIGGVFHYDGTAFTEIASGHTTGSYLGAAGDVWISGDSAIVHWDGSAATVVTPAAVSVETTIGGARYTSGSDVTWVAEGTGYNEAPTTLVHWDGTQFTTTPIDTAYTAVGDNVCPALGGIGVIDDKLAMFCQEGDVATLTIPAGSGDVQEQVVIAPFEASTTSEHTLWGTSTANVYQADGDLIRHWNGTSWSNLTQDAVLVRGLGGTGVGGADELFAEHFTYAGSNGYTTFIDHFDGSAWSTVQATQYQPPVFEFIADVYPLGTGEALVVGGNGVAFHYASGALTPIATGTTADLYGVVAGSDADTLSIAGGSGTLLQWQRSNPGVFTVDASFPATTDDLDQIVYAGSTTWIMTAQQEHVYRKLDGGTWQTVAMPVAAISIAAIADDDVVVSASDSGMLARWNGSAFDVEYYPAWRQLQNLYALPDGTTMLSGDDGIITHAPPVGGAAVGRRRAGRR